MTLASTTSELADVAALVLPTKQTASSPANVGFSLAHSLLVHSTVQEDPDMVTSIDVANGDFVLALADQASLDLDQLSVTIFHLALLVLQCQYNNTEQRPCQLVGLLLFVCHTILKHTGENRTPLLLTIGYV